MMVEGYDGNHIWCSKCKVGLDSDHFLIMDNRTRPSWCPIKEMPERKNGYFDIIVAPYGSGEQKGWNDCIDFLESKTNG